MPGAVKALRPVISVIICDSQVSATVQNVFGRTLGRGYNTMIYAWFRLFLLLVVAVCPMQVLAEAVAQEKVEAVSGPVYIPKAKGKEAAKQARKELQQLLDQSLHFATGELLKKATFYPFLVGMTSQGQIELIGVPADAERPAPETAVKALRKAARQLADKKRFKAYALYVDFVAERRDTALKQPGVRVELEHEYPDALSVFIPYFIHDNGQISLLTPQFMPARPRFFSE